MSVIEIDEEKLRNYEALAETRKRKLCEIDAQIRDLRKKRNSVAAPEPFIVVPRTVSLAPKETLDLSECRVATAKFLEDFQLGQIDVCIASTGKWCRDETCDLLKGSLKSTSEKREDLTYELYLVGDGGWHRSRVVFELHSGKDLIFSRDTNGALKWGLKKDFIGKKEALDVLTVIATNYDFSKTIVTDKVLKVCKEKDEVYEIVSNIDEFQRKMYHWLKELCNK